eukprot:1744460-Rhodomonas_salina.3
METVWSDKCALKARARHKRSHVCTTHKRSEVVCTIQQHSQTCVLFSSSVAPRPRASSIRRRRLQSAGLDMASGASPWSRRRAPTTTQR